MKAAFNRIRNKLGTSFIFNFVFIAFSFCVGVSMFVDAYRFYDAGMTNIALLFGLGGCWLLWLHLFLGVMINHIATRRALIWVETYRMQQDLNISKMEIELAMRRTGMNVPKSFEATIPAVHELNGELLFHKCDDLNCD